MSQPTPGMNLHGAVDLSGLAQRAQSQSPAGGRGGPGGGAPGGASGTGDLIVSVTEAAFGEVVQRSTEVPVILNVTSARSGASAELTPVLERLAREYGGRFQLAHVDADSEVQIAAALQVQSLPTVVALIGGRPAPLFQGAYPEEQVRQVLDEVLRIAQQSGITGTVEAGEPGAQEEQPVEEPLPPLHAEARAAIERGDLAAAEDAYSRALKESPADQEAQAALLQVRLLRRVEAADTDQVLATASGAAPAEAGAHLAAADVEAASGRFQEAFDRLLRVIRATAGEDREQARVRLVELFEIAGQDHPAVAPARRQLASALY